MANTIQVKRGTSAFPSLAAGEFATRTDTGEVVIGDGSNKIEVLTETKFGANTLVKADSADTPISMTVAEDTIVGRKTGGSITALTGSEILNILSGTATSSFSANSQKVTDVAAPASNNDAANKQYVDSTAEGLDVKESVRVASTGSNIDIATGGEITVDGVSLTSGDRVLLKDQSTASENGIYAVNTGAWSRTVDADASEDLNSGAFTFVEEGTVNGNNGFALTVDGSITIGTTSLSFSQFSGTGQITPGTNLTKSGNTLDVSPQGSGSGLNADQLDGTELANIVWTDTSMATSDVSASDVGLGSVDNKALTNVTWTDVNMATGDVTQSDVGLPNVEDIALSVASWADINIATTDVSQGDVGLGSVENIALSTAGWADIGISTSDVTASDVSLGSVENIALSNAGWSDINIATSDVIDSSPTNGETAMAPSSDWAYDHENNLSAHGAGGNVLGDTDIIDGGTF